MILQALSRYYDRLATDPNEEIAPFGFSRQKVAFAVVVNPDGSLSGIEDLRTLEGKRAIAASVQVCGDAKPSGAGINPCFLWDNPAYMLGYKPEDPKPERTAEAFEAFRQRHLQLESTIDDPGFSAVCRFLEHWDPAQAAQHPTLVDIGTGFGVFRLSGEARFLHDRPAVHQWWLTQIRPGDEDQVDSISAQCLVTGEVSRLARLHEPKIKGVSGAQSSGAAIVSFNLEAFESYGKSQSYNAPVSEQAAFQYCTALNRLLSDRTRRVQIGDATVVFWTEQPNHEAEGLFGFAFGNPPEDAALADHLQKTLQTIGQGAYPSEFSNKETPFYVLGLSPNAARISIRFWHVSTLGRMVENLRSHYAGLEIARSEKDPEFIPPWQILRETARESKEIPPLLSGALMQAILTGGPYPRALYSSLLRRVRADREIRCVRAAAIKACLNRSDLLSRPLPSMLDPDRPETAYQLGRLFAVLESIHAKARESAKDMMRDRYLSVASATPFAIFPTLLEHNRRHLSSLVRPDSWRGTLLEYRRTVEARVWSITSLIRDMPKISNSREQGIFYIGYYHQRQHIFQSAAANRSITENEE